MKRPRSNASLSLLIVIGVALGVTSVILHWTLPERFEKVEIIPIVVGFGLALFGAYWKDPDRAKRAADGVTHAGDEVVDTLTKLRTGKRATDPVVEIKKSHPADDPSAEPTVEVTVTKPGTPSVPPPTGDQ